MLHYLASLGYTCYDGAYVYNGSMCLYHRICASDLGAYDAQALRVAEQMAEAQITQKVNIRLYLPIVLRPYGVNDLSL